MKVVLRVLNDHRYLWRLWLPLLLVGALLPLAGVAMPLVERRLIDQVLLARHLRLLPQTIALYAGLWLLSTVANLAGTALGTLLGQQLVQDLYQRLFDHSERLSLAFAHREHTGRTMALFANDAPNVMSLFSTLVVSGFSSLIAVAIAAAAMLSLSWQLALVAGILPPLIAGGAAVVTRPLRPASRRVQEKAAELSERLQENLSGMREVVAFGRERAQSRRYGEALRELMRLRLRVIFLDTAIGTGQNLFSLTITLVILGFGGYLVIRGQTTIGTLVAMRSLFGMVYTPAGQLMALVGNVQKALGGAERVYAFLDERPRVEERAGARPPRGVVGAVAFEGVGFGYAPGRPVLQGVSFAARPGELVALVGPSGAGKSTLMSLLARFYDPTAGRVTLDGADLRDLTLAGLREQIGIVFQDTFLFATTVRENVAFGREGAAEVEVVAALRAANAWEFVERLPRGLDTRVGERGVQLSEGQKQRLAIARALLRDPRILILDEPTSALDARSEHLLQAALDNLMRGRTTFVIAHRLATVQRADRLLVLEDGRVVEQGTHAELLRRRGLYHELYELQFGAGRQRRAGAREPDDGVGRPVAVTTLA